MTSKEIVEKIEEALGSEEGTVVETEDGETLFIATSSCDHFVLNPVEMKKFPWGKEDYTAIVADFGTDDADYRHFLAINIFAKMVLKAIVDADPKQVFIDAVMLLYIEEYEKHCPSMKQFAEGLIRVMGTEEPGVQSICRAYVQYRLNEAKVLLDYCRAAAETQSYEDVILSIAHSLYNF